jgi:hypothetical protein
MRADPLRGLVGHPDVAREPDWEIDRMIAELLQTMRELHRRRVDGIDVRLLWRQDNGQVLVAVVDDKTGEEFTVEVPEDERALDVFHHPFAYSGQAVPIAA